MQWRDSCAVMSWGTVYTSSLFVFHTDTHRSCCNSRPLGSLDAQTPLAAEHTHTHIESLMSSNIWHQNCGPFQFTYLYYVCFDHREMVWEVGQCVFYCGQQRELKDEKRISQRVIVLQGKSRRMTDWNDSYTSYWDAVYIIKTHSRAGCSSQVSIVAGLSRWDCLCPRLASLFRCIIAQLPTLVLFVLPFVRMSDGWRSSCLPMWFQRRRRISGKEKVCLRLLDHMISVFFKRPFLWFLL